MLDNQLIKKNFKKSLNTYNDNAFVQSKMAKEFVLYLENKKYNKVLEVGSYTGFLTSEVVSKIDFDKYLALDIVDSFDFIKNLSYKITFQKTSIEDFKTDEKFDLIISNASLQWVDDFGNIYLKLKSMLNKNGKILISIFGDKNLIEIKDIFNVSLNYYSKEKLEELFKEEKIISKIEKIHFKNSLDILRHLKYTGVNSITKNKLSYKELKEKLKLLETKYDNTLTYNPIYIID